MSGVPNHRRPRADWRALAQDQPVAGVEIRAPWVARTFMDFLHFLHSLAIALKTSATGAASAFTDFLHFLHSLL